MKNLSETALAALPNVELITCLDVVGVFPLWMEAPIKCAVKV